MIKSRSILAALAAGTFVIAGCSAGSTDYKKAAEKAINDSEQFEDGECVKPGSTDVGTTFECTATFVADGTTYPLTATIDKKDHVVVGDSQADPAAEDTTPVEEETEETTGS